MLISSSNSGERCPCKASFHVRACGMCVSLYYGYGGALQSPETTKAHPLSVEEVGFDPNSMNNRPRRPSSSTPSCVAATTGATTATAATTQSRKDMGRHGDHHHCTYCVRSHKSRVCAAYHSVLSSVNLCLPVRLSFCR